MLVRLFGGNFRSIKGDFELSMVAAELTRKEDRRRGVVAVRLAGASEPLMLLRCAAIYGANASGKTTVLTAAKALHWLVTASSAWSKPGARIPPYEPFSLDDRSSAAPIHLGCDIVLKNNLIRYEIEFDAETIKHESLSLFDADREIKIIDRLPSGEVGGDLIIRSDANRLYVKEMQPNVAVLSKLAQHGPQKGPESVQPFYQAVRNATHHEDYSDSAQMQFRLGGPDEWFATDANYRDWIMRHLMQAADVGICDVATRRENVKLPDQLRAQLEKDSDGFKVPDTRVIVSFIHEGASRRPIDFKHESSGTKKLFNMAGDWWRLANDPFTLHADELSASLHPRLLDRLIRTVNDPPSKQIRSQLIFATHDAGLLEGQDGRPPALRRDQVYFAQKGDDGATELYSLAEFKEDATPVHNIRKRYLSGLYGAIPSVEKLSL